MKKLGDEKQVSLDGVATWNAAADSKGIRPDFAFFFSDGLVLFAVSQDNSHSQISGSGYFGSKLIFVGAEMHQDLVSDLSGYRSVNQDHEPIHVMVKPPVSLQSRIVSTMECIERLPASVKAHESKIEIVKDDDVISMDGRLKYGVTPEQRDCLAGIVQAEKSLERPRTDVHGEGKDEAHDVGGIVFSLLNLAGKGQGNSKL